MAMVGTPSPQPHPTFSWMYTTAVTAVSLASSTPKK
uniref:Uncharacterized protein n=1 Tax=Arundo donax TaxID=35708 RepID=A0A0A9T2D7_ARUDO